MATIQALSKALEDTAMNSLMMTLQQPLSVAALAHCLGWGPARASLPAAQRQRQREHQRQHRQRARSRAAAALRTDVHQVQDAAAVADDEAASKGCGWFDSSRDLHQGLVVLEHSGVENLGAELPITVWLGLVLDGAATAASGPTASGLGGVGSQGMITP